MYASHVVDRFSILMGAAVILLVLAANYEIRTSYCGCDINDDIFNKFLDYSQCSSFSFVLLWYLLIISVASSLSRILYLRIGMFILSIIYFCEAYAGKTSSIPIGSHHTGVEFYYVFVMYNACLVVLYGAFKLAYSIIK